MTDVHYCVGCSHKTSRWDRSETVYPVLTGCFWMPVSVWSMMMPLQWGHTWGRKETGLGNSPRKSVSCSASHPPSLWGGHCHIWPSGATVCRVHVLVDTDTSVEASHTSTSVYTVSVEDFHARLCALLCLIGCFLWLLIHVGTHPKIYLKFNTQ